MRTLGNIVACLGFATGIALGQAPDTLSPRTGFDCWIGNDGAPYSYFYIRCIADRDIPYEHEPNQRLDLLLESLHRELHGASGATAENTFKSNIQLIREGGGVWNIRIFSYPYESSWAQRLPERLVRAVLCPNAENCSVVIHKR